MKILDIITVPNKLLLQVSKPVEKIDHEVKVLAMNMLETMYENNGVGLAAVQVGVLKRIIVVDVWHDNETRPLLMINPEIIEYSDTQKDFAEGCLSVPGIRKKISRPSEITVKYFDLNGAEHVINADGLLAVCIQHEIDHLNGIVIEEKGELVLNGED